MLMKKNKLPFKKDRVLQTKFFYTKRSQGLGSIVSQKIGLPQS
jgi:hypothetical protein